MEVQKDDEKIIDIGDQSVKTETDPSDDIRKQAEELFKAAGGFAGSIGKYAAKKGAQLKDMIEDEEFQEKVNSNIKAVTDRIDNYVSSDSAMDRTVIPVKGISGESEEHSKEKSAEDIEMSVEVEGKETVEFQTDSAKKEPTGPIAKAKQARAEKKAEKERKRIEAERAREEKRKQSLIVSIIMFSICIIALVMMSINEKSVHEGQLHAPLSSFDASSLKYEEVVTAFEDVGFTNVSTLTIEDSGDEGDDRNGLVEKVTVDGEEYYDTDEWFDPAVKIIVYYHVRSETKTTEESQQVDAANNKDENEASNKLAELIGMTCDVADPKVREMGYEPKYLTYEANGIVTFEVDLDKDSLNEWTVYEINEISGTEVTLIVKSQFMEERDKERAEVNASLSDSEARDIAYKFIQYNMTKSFRLKDIPQYSIMDGGKRIWSLCKFKDDNGNNIDAEVIAQVDAKTKEVTMVEVRNSTYGVIWSYNK